MNRLIIAATLTLASLPAHAKEWQWQAFAIDGSTAKLIAEGSSCNYQSSISQARKAGEASKTQWAIGFTGVDNLEACPKAVKATTTPKDSPPAN